MNKDYYLARTGGNIIPEEFVKNRLNFYLKERTRIQYYSDLTLPR
jgi:hypothetical protein